MTSADNKLGAFGEASDWRPALERGGERGACDSRRAVAAPNLYMGRPTSFGWADAAAANTSRRRRQLATAALVALLCALGATAQRPERRTSGAGRLPPNQVLFNETAAAAQRQDSARNAQAAARDEGRAAAWAMPNRPSLFSIIRFPNEECFDSSNQSGTCYTAFECKLLGGQPSSPCAAGFGSCCIVSRTCHVTTREKVVYFKNPSYPSTDSDEKFCDLTVEMSDVNVCQLRLDFLDFQLDPPTNGACKDDYMEISASGMPPQTVPRLCGLNRNQHRK